jgi:hypothetical protein
LKIGYEQFPVGMHFQALSGTVALLSVNFLLDQLQGLLRIPLKLVSQEHDAVNLTVTIYVSCKSFRYTFMFPV